eukprot:COSAG01_NODE_7486_length_3190_cov_1.620511_3_plen_82_part_00
MSYLCPACAIELQLYKRDSHSKIVAMFVVHHNVGVLTLCIVLVYLFLCVSFVIICACEMTCEGCGLTLSVCTECTMRVLPA